jgi:hypothetical protein
MRLGTYRFGRIDIEGQPYRADVIVTPKGVVEAWWRGRSHTVAVDDLTEIIATRPDILVVGTGYFGRMVVSDDARRHLQAHEIELREARTPQAVAEFNRLQARHARIAAALHLTC